MLRSHPFLVAFRFCAKFDFFVINFVFLSKIAHLSQARGTLSVLKFALACSWITGFKFCRDERPPQEIQNDSLFTLLSRVYYGSKSGRWRSPFLHHIDQKTRECSFSLQITLTNVFFIEARIATEAAQWNLQFSIRFARYFELVQAILPLVFTVSFFWARMH